MRFPIDAPYQWTKLPERSVDMRIRFAFVLLSGFVASASAQQQSPFTTPATAPGTQTTAGQTTTPANQGIATNPLGEGTSVQPGTTDPALGATGGIATNQLGRNLLGTNGVSGGTSPLFLNVNATTITDANGSPIGVLQQLALSPNGTVNFGVLNVGGRMVPVPWQLIVTGTGGTRGTLALNAEPGILQRAPTVGIGQLPVLAQEDWQAQILNHFGLTPNSASVQPTTVTTGTARGGTGGAGVTITGGATNTAMTGTAFGTATNSTGGAITNGSTFPNNSAASNHSLNTSGGLLSPTGRTNVAYDGFNSGPGSTDRFGPRQNANPTQPRPTVPPPAPQSPR
jgi:hypothetical protein